MPKQSGTGTGVGTVKKTTRKPRAKHPLGGLVEAMRQGKVPGIVLNVHGSPAKKAKQMRLLLSGAGRGGTLGTHRTAKLQRKVLNTTGNRHESEHTIGFNVYAQSFDRKASGDGKAMEGSGLAYLEVKELHRDHPGTGTGKDADAYRKDQRAILEQGRDGHTTKTVSSAIQLNQLEYAIMQHSMTGAPGKEELTIAEISYEAMVRNGDSVTFHDGTKSHSFQISQVERAEMLLAYEARHTGAWPSQERIAEVLKACGLTPQIIKRNGKDIMQ